MALSDLFISPDLLPPGVYGYIQLLFLLAVYGFILFKASKCIADGSELLTMVMNPGLIGGLVLPVMGAVPDGAIVLFSGLGPNAQEQLAVGVGTLAGSTIMLLTLPFAASIWLGRVDLSADGSRALYRQAPKLTKPRSNVTGTGVQVSADIPRAALLMLATALTYLLVQGPSWAREGVGAARGFALAGLVVSVLAFVAYAAFCLFSATALEAQKDRATALRKRALADHLVGFTAMWRIEEQLASEALAKAAAAGAGESEAGLMPATASGAGGAGVPGAATHAAVSAMFAKYDVDGSGSIDLPELRAMLAELGMPRLSTSDLKDLMRDVGGADMSIQLHEFEELVSRAAALHLAEGASSVRQRVQAANDEVSAHAHGSDEGGEDEDDDEEEDEALVRTPSQIKAKALLLLCVGVGMVTFFSDPMVDVLAALGNRMGIKPFYVSFVISPLVSNASELISSLMFASRKTQASMDMTLSALLGAATMNNTFCLAIFLALVYFRELSWAFSAEVTAILVCECAVAALAYTTRPTATWKAALPAVLYPLSLLLVWFLEAVVGWD